MEGHPRWQLPLMTLAIVSSAGFTLWSVRVSVARYPAGLSAYPWQTALVFAVAAVIGAILILIEESGTLTVVVWLGSLYLTITAVSGGVLLWLAFAAQTLAFLATAAVMWLYYG
ncbi:MAG: hypothetical protein J2P30_24775 [Actinobacteria bacterium]|nr:hypothetical protein [Actinomycetota bacterium]